MKYFKFELKRISRNRKNKILFLIATLLLVALVVYSASLKSSNTPKSLEGYLNQSISMTSQSLKGIKGDKTAPKSVISDIETNLNLLNGQKTALEQKNVNHYYQIQLEINKLSLKNDQVNVADIKNENAYIRTVINRHLNFENYSGAQLHAFGITHEIFTPLIFSSLFCLVFMLMGGISFASDFESDSMKLYKTPTFNGKNIVLTTFITNFFIVGIWYLLAFLLYIISVGLLNGFGALNYPSGINGLLLVENWKIDGIYLLWGFLLIAFIIACGIYLSFLLKRSLLVIGSFAIIILGYNMIENQGFMQGLRKFLPMAYFDPVELLQKTSYLPAHALIIGLFYLFALSLVFIGLSIIHFRKLHFRKIK